MKRINGWSRSVGIGVVMSIAVAGAFSPAFAGTGVGQLEIAQETPIQEAAPGSLVGQCRAAKQSTPVYDKNTPGAKVIRTLSTNEQVRLADNGSNGFIGIDSPVKGFVSTADLKTCGTTTPPVGNTCRRVIQPQGLVIRRDANPNSATLGGVGYLERVFLTTTPATSRVGPDGRNWIQIAKPVAGWVSNGFPGNTSNLSLCP